MNEYLEKVCTGVESALSIKQCDFGLVSTHYFELLDRGEVDEIDLYIAFKKMEKFVESILPFLKDRIDETKLRDGYSKHFINLSTRAGKPTYDFSRCGDSEYEMLIEQKKEIDALVKGKEDFLKAITKEFTDEETGEVIKAPLKKQGVNLVLTYVKQKADA
ncbi:hypothetical protein [Sphingobacterium corticibacter]|uniref:Uncharacterized protein n=1 Tax=Sphingobacterium corticibacter TaxID=2171749 RepID=A0A2T8HLH0_9SPHI|nr:hypothetical protein [Sphingobacterium corticibacter]PVH26255.1 hypothetical protein DC487_01120 [Sphingobacterium corticibacter]